MNSLLKYLWLILGLSFLWCYSAEGQIAIEWQKCYGGLGGEYAESLIQTFDGGFAFAGDTDSNDGDVSGNHGGSGDDIWVVKTDSVGTLEWQICLGGTSNETNISLVQSPDSGLAVLSYATSNDGDLSQAIQNSMWLVKLSKTGTIQWSKLFSGYNPNVRGQLLIATSDGGFVLSTGYLLQVTLSFGVVKVDSAGNIVWQYSYGGSRDEMPYSIIKCNDGGYMVSGFTNSDDGDVTGWHADSTWESQSLSWIYSYDIWVVKLDSMGILEWQKCYGGTDDESAWSTAQTLDTGYIISGFSFSNDGDVTDSLITGIYNNWVVKIDSVGNIQWNRRPSGLYTWLDIIQSNDSNFIVFGYNYDFGVCKMDSVGNTVWLKIFGSNGYERGLCGIQASDGSFVMGGRTNNNSRDVTGFHGGTDVWLVKFTERVNTIQGTLFIDANSNSIQDSGEVSIRNKMVTETTTGKTAYTDYNGNYMLSVLDTGSFQITSATINYYNASPLMHGAQFSSILQTDSLNDFAYQPSGVANDFCMSLSAAGNFRSGMAAYYLLNYINEGNTQLTPSIVFYPSQNISFTSSTPPPDIVTQDSIIWNFNVLNPFESGNINITVLVDLVPLGTLISSNAIINPVLNDVQPLCNYDTASINITGAVDPNNILVNRNFIYDFDIANPPALEYQINFQNIGNDTAFTISVWNEISNMLDLNSFEFIAASHPVSISYETYNNNYKFNFNAIKLPDSTTNESLSHGFVRYRIKPKTNLVAGDTIPNSADIYFDLNGYVSTNVVKTAIILPTGQADYLNLPNKLIIYPNPAKQTITIKKESLYKSISNKTQHIKVYDIYGKLIHTKIFDSNLSDITIEIANLPDAIYILSIDDGNFITYSRFVKTTY